jgi:hypothetical protein
VRNVGIMTESTYSALNASERDWISHQLESARLFVATMSPADAADIVTLEALDRAWAAWLPRAGTDNTQINATINAVGIQFGQVLVDEAGFAWTIAADAQGSDLAVLALPGQGDLLVYPANFIAKRWERRESDFLVSSYSAIRNQVAVVAGAPIRRPWWQFW